MRVMAVRAGGSSLLRMNRPSIGLINLLVAFVADRVLYLLLRDMAVEAPDPFLPVHGLAKEVEGRKLRDENPWGELQAVWHGVSNPHDGRGKTGPFLMALTAGCRFLHDLVHIAACPVLPFQLETLKTLSEQGL